MMNVYHMIKLLSKNSHDGSTSVMSRTSFLIAEVRFLQGKSSFISTLSSHLVMSLLPYFCSWPRVLMLLLSRAGQIWGLTANEGSLKCQHTPQSHAGGSLPCR